MLRKKLMLLAATAITSGLLAAPAFADVNVKAVIDKDKIITVTEQISITKDIDIDVTFTGDLQGLGESDALVNASIIGNQTDLRLPGSQEEVGDDNFTKRRAKIGSEDVGADTGAMNKNDGVVLQVNQDVGENANQGNILSAAVTDVEDGPATGRASAVAHAEAGVSQVIDDNQTILTAEFPSLDGFPNEDSDFHVVASVRDSMNDNIGAIVQANQNAGQNANQHNVVSVAVGLDAGLALGEAALGQENSSNEIIDLNTFKTAIVDNSMNSNQGIVSLNQNAGHNNNQATVINIAATSQAQGLTPNNSTPFP